MSGEHKTVPVQVWADVDEGIAPLVKYLNTIPGIRTHASCQGAIGEGGAEPYGPYVLVSYQTDEAEMRLSREFDCTEVFMSTARVHPREGWTAPEENCNECGGVPCRLPEHGHSGSTPSVESPETQIARLANFIMAKIPGEPSQSESAVDCAIRLLMVHTKSGRPGRNKLLMKFWAAMEKVEFSDEWDAQETIKIDDLCQLMAAGHVTTTPAK